MAKNILLLIALLNLLILNIYAQDTSAYQLQRSKVNALLAERSEKFGRYDESLNARTGIFGFQTKRDIKNSNEILRQIALTDNDIFRELKVLLNYKDLQVEQVKTKANSTSENLLNYRKSIKNLQDKNEEMDTKIKSYEQKTTLFYTFIIIMVITIVILVYQLLSKNKQLKKYEKANV